MTERKTLNVSLAPDPHTFTYTLVEGVTYGNASEVVRDGPRALQRQQRRDAGLRRLVASDGTAGRDDG